MELLGLTRKRAQAWGSDLVIAFSIFSFCILLIYMYLFSDGKMNKNNFEEMNYDAQRISSLILSEGYPPDWTYSNLLQIGILTDGKINNTKLHRFKNLDYSRAKGLFNTKYDYYFYVKGFEEETGVGNSNYLNSKNLAKVSRVVVYNNTIAVANLYVFENG